MIKLPFAACETAHKVLHFCNFQCLIVPDHTVEQLWLITVNKVD